MLKDTVPLPCPFAPFVIVSHGWSLVAVQVQSRVVVTSSVLDVPDAGADPCIWFATVTWHFNPVGAVTSTELEAEQAATRKASAHAGNSRARIAVEHCASALPVKGRAGMSSHFIRPDAALLCCRPRAPRLAALSGA